MRSRCKQRATSRTMYRTVNPQWDETFTFGGTLHDLLSTPLSIEVFDDDRLSRDDSLGVCGCRNALAALLTPSALRVPLPRF